MNSTAQLADRKTGCIWGRVTMEMTIGLTKIEPEFFVADPSKEILLGMDLYQSNDCLIDFYQLKIREWDVAVFNRLGQPQAVHIQSNSTCDTPAFIEEIIKAKLNRYLTKGLGMVETRAL